MSLLSSIFQFIAKWEWGQRVIMASLAASAGVYFDIIKVWPGNGTYLKVVIFATDQFSLKSCIAELKDEIYAESVEQTRS